MEPMTMLALATAASTAGGFLSGQKKKKAQKNALRSMQRALNAYKAGSIDALGNKLSANKNNVWSYDLNNSGKAARDAANNANYKLGTTADKTAAELSRNALTNKNLANTMTARANQTAAMRSGARTNSNLGNIANSFSQAGSQRLRDNYMQGLQAGQNAVNYNAQMRQNLGQAASAAGQPIGNIQGNLQNMVGNLNNNVANIYKGIAATRASDNNSATGGLLQGLGGALGMLGGNMQNQANFEQLLAMLGTQQQQAK